MGPSDKPKRESAAKLWTLRTTKHTRLKVDFLSTEAERLANPKILSCFNGLELDATQPIAYGTCSWHSGVQLVLKHISRVLANSDGFVYNYLLGWHAYALQTYDKVGVTLVFYGEPGTGKSTLYYKSTHNVPIFQTLYGATYQGTGGLSEITARFNSTSESKLLCVCDEIGVEEGSKSMDKIKLLADSSEQTIEYKHHDAVRIKDHRNNIFLTNHRNAFGVDGANDDFTRKILLTQVSDEFSKAKCDADPALAARAKQYSVL